MSDHLPARRHLPEPDDAEVVDGEPEDDVPPKRRRPHRDPYAMRSPRLTIRGRVAREDVLDAPETSHPDWTCFVAFGGRLFRLTVEETMEEPFA
jgi:hypothetical protein